MRTTRAILYALAYAIAIFAMGAATKCHANEQRPAVDLESLGTCEWIKVAATGSMVPVFDGGDVLLVSYSKWADLRMGQIIVYRDARFNGQLVAHRLIRKVDGRWWALGDAVRDRHDGAYVCENDFVGTVKAIFYR